MTYWYSFCNIPLLPGVGEAATGLGYLSFLQLATQLCVNPGDGPDLATP